MMEFAVVTGQSGAGRSQTANFLEDLGWFVIDNLPSALISKVSELAAVPGGRYERIALVAGVGDQADQISAGLRELKMQDDVRVRVLFLQANTPALVRRYESTKRPHPWDPSLSLIEAIEAERVALEVVREAADIVVDTSNTSVHQLRDRVEAEFGSNYGDSAMHIRVVSFGYKHGLPLDVDLVFDCRFLPNPHWVEELRPLTGRDPAVGKYLTAQEITGRFLGKLFELLDILMPAYEREGKSYLSLALGCTGGQHRSVWIARQVRAYLEESGYHPRVSHRDIDRR